MDDPEKILDEFAAVDEQLKAIKARHKVLSDRLNALVPADLAADDTWTIESARHEITLSAQGFERRITDMGAVYKALGMRAFVRAASMTLKSLDSAVADPADRDRLTVTERTGPRRWTVVRKFTAAA